MEEILKSFIEEEMLEDETISFDESLFQSQKLDSIFLTELILFIDNEFKIKVHPMDINFDNFDSIDKITKYIKTKL